MTGKRWLFSLLVLLHVLWFVAQLPASYSLSNFVFYDPGSALRVDRLIANGLVPTVDFGYPYGLLPLMIGRAFFGIVGRTPSAYVLFMFLSEVVVLFGLWRLVRHASWWIVALTIVALPHAVLPMYLHLTHPLEAALLVHALADLTEGRRARAFALATACVFVKPSMAYVFGGLVILLALARTRDGWRSVAVAMLPGFVTAVVCWIATATAFGVGAATRALVPLNGAQSYQALGFGIWASGREFWFPPLPAAQLAAHLINTPAGFWIASTVTLIAFGVTAMASARKNVSDARASVAVAALCHLAFLFVFFGWAGSWTYYSSVLVGGVVLGAAVFRLRPAIIVTLIALALAGSTARAQSSQEGWRWMRRLPETAGLWAFRAEREDWIHARELAGDRPFFYFANGCPELLFPNIEAPASFFLSPSQQTPVEIEHIRQQLTKAAVVVTFNESRTVLDPWTWPEFAHEREAFHELWRGRYLTVHERARNPGTSDRVR